MAARDRRIQPSEIGPTEDGARLRISWGDGERSEYVPRELRIEVTPLKLEPQF